MVSLFFLAMVSRCRAWALELWLSSCGVLVSLPLRVWNLRGVGIEPTSPSLAGGFLIMGPLEKPIL